MDNPLEIDKEKYEKIINQTYPGIVLLFRDVNLDDSEKKYEAGLIIREKGFTDASRRGGGIITTHRFALLSNHFGNFSSFEHGTNWGLCVMQKDSHFKVLDIYKKREKTQITFLHLPEEGWEIFQDCENNLDTYLIEHTRKRFDECLDLPPVPELTTKEWLMRCALPFGISDTGEYYPLKD